MSFALSTLSYISMAIIGYLMFGQGLESQVTLNLPTSKFSSKIAIYTTLVGPLAKYALVVTPIAEAMESQLPSNYKIRAISILIRTLLLISTVIVALVIPFFGLLMALIGSILSVTVSILLPCLCYLKIFESYKRLGLELVIILGVVVLALSVGVMGTYSSLKRWWNIFESCNTGFECGYVNLGHNGNILWLAKVCIFLKYQRISNR